MAELQFEAPLATFECEEWNEFNDFQTSNNDPNSNNDPKIIIAKHKLAEMDNFSEKITGSLEDLVNTFDEKITECFKNYDEEVETIAPVQVRKQDEIMKDCQMWWTITGNYGNILPIDWSTSYARKLQTQALKLGEKREAESPDLDLSDDEELVQAFDMHSLILSPGMQHEPVLTADEVIDEIEDMMQEGDKYNDGSDVDVDMLSPLTTQLYALRGIDTTSSETYKESLMKLSTTSLNELVEEMKCTIETYSATLVTELAHRDEREFDKELKNQFISLVVDVQRKRREYQLERKKSNKKIKGGNDGNYLTTVIPYNSTMGVPSNEQLQIYIKLLRAIKEDSTTVPSLLTDYILKVLCPTGQ